MTAETSEDLFWATDAREGRRTHPLLALVHKRDEILYYWEKIVPRIELSGNVLEIGSGSSWLSAINKIRFPSVVSFATDVSKNALQKGVQVSALIGVRVDHFVASASEFLPFPDRSFDFVIGSAMLHHTHLESAAREIHRVLNPGGVYIGFREPFIPKPLAWIWGSRFGLAGGREHHHGVREGLYTLKEWKQAFEEAGFKDIDITLEKDPQYRNENWFVNLYYRVLRHLPDSVIMRIFACSFVIEAKKSA